MTEEMNLKTLQEMAQLLHVHTATLRAWAKAEMMPYHRIGKKYYFRPEEVLKSSTAAKENSDVKHVQALCAEHNGFCISNGYLNVKIGKHPMANKNGYIPLHRLIIQAKLGRPLAPNEIVHHKNGNTLDNRIENLELMESLSKHNSEKKFHKEG